MEVITNSGEKYILKECIGKGGMARVYSAIRERGGGLVAVKLLNISKSGKAMEEAKRELADEIRILEALEKKGIGNVPRILGEGEDFYVMDYVCGKTMGRGESDAKECIETGMALCDILSGLHEGRPSVLHLDLKPSNIIRKGNGEICLIDFGTARIPGTYSDRDIECLGYGAGTKGYAAPEQYGGLVSESIQTDIYLLGRTLDVIMKKVGKDHFLADELKRVICRCTVVRKGGRYPDCREVKKDLFACYKKADSRKRIFALEFFAGLLLFVFSVIFILMFFAGKVSILYGIFSVFMGRFFWNSERLARDFCILKGQKPDEEGAPDEMDFFLNIVKTCDTIEI